MKILFGAIGVLSLLLLSFFFFSPTHTEQEYRKEKEKDLILLSQTEYNGVFFGMFPLDNYDTGEISHYKGLNTLKLGCPLKNTEDLETYLETAFLSGNDINTFYLAINPEIIWENCDGNSSKIIEKLRSHILPFTQQNPQVQFQVILSTPSLDYWTQKSSEEAINVLSAYRTVTSCFAPYENILTHFIGAEEWFIANPDNYADAFALTADGASKQLVFTLAHKYLLTPETTQVKFDTLQALIEQSHNTPTQYPDLSFWDIVFFGDSIIGNYTGSTSVPGAISGLSSANTYNCGIGGTAASKSVETELNFPMMVNAFITGNLDNIPSDMPFGNSYLAYNQATSKGHQLCFVINYGLNDYFRGLPVSNPENPEDVTTYAGALRNGISLLQENYPDALIILMAPTFTTSFSCGTDINSEKGGALTDYVDTAQMVAKETNVVFINNYVDLGINEENAIVYLSDTIHLNESGRFLLAQHFIAQLDSVLTQ